MNQLQIFNYQEHPVRTVHKDGEPWFVLKDVCEILGITHITDTAKRLEEDEVGQTEVIDSIGRKQTATCINESGLYNVILRSDKPEAKPFRKWVTSEVLPSIRKHGAYMTPETLEVAILNPDTMIKLCTALKDEQSKNAMLTGEVAKRDQIIAELNPKATYYDLILQCTDVVSPSKIAKDYGKSAKWLNEKLHELGVQFKQGKVWLLYQKYASFGYTQSRTFPVVRSDGTPGTEMSTYWTQKGRLFIYELLKDNGIIPIIEKPSN